MPRRTYTPTNADLERDVARLLDKRPDARARRVAYDQAADEAARSTAQTRGPGTTPAVHRNAARANLAAADRARALRDDEAAVGHERLAAAHEQAALRQETDAPPSDTEVARAVHDAIRRIGASGRFGPDRVFISEIWAVASRDPRFRRMAGAEFKRALVRANRQRLIDLERADLVGAMDPRQVRASEIVDLGSSFHFVLDPEAQGIGEGGPRAPHPVQ